MAASDGMEEQCPQLHSVELQFWAEAKSWAGAYHPAADEPRPSAEPPSLLQLIDALVWEE